MVHLSLLASLNLASFECTYPFFIKAGAPLLVCLYRVYMPELVLLGILGLQLYTHLNLSVCIIPYSGNISREKTFAYWWKMEFCGENFRRLLAHTAYCPP